MSIYQFDDCRLDTDRRELHQGGRLRRLEPKVFDLLGHLVLHAGRVMRREELLARFWPGEAVSDSPLNRAVMKVRNALGGPGGAGRHLKTVHRVGYRLDAVVACLRPEAEAVIGGHDGTGPKTGAPPLLGLLPVCNASSVAGAEWADMSLQALLHAELAQAPTLRLASVEQLAAITPGHAGPALDPPELMLQIGLSWSDGRWHAECRALDAPRDLLHLQVDATDLARLARHLAAALLDSLNSAPVQELLAVRRQAAALRPRGGTHAQMPAAAGLRMLQDAQWQRAAELLKAAVQRDPRSAELADACAWALASAADPAAAGHAERLLRRAERSGHLELAARAHHALAMAQANRVGVGPRSRQHLAQALALAERAGQPDLVRTLRAALAHQWTQARNFAAARRLYHALLSAQEAEGQPPDIAKILHNLAVIEAVSGNPLGARGRLERALRIARQAGQPNLTVSCTVNLAQVECELGCLDNARALVGQALAQWPGMSDHRLAAGSAMTLSLIQAELADLPGLAHTANLVAGLAAGGAQPMRMASSLVQGLQHAAGGAHHAAHAAVREAVRLSLSLEEGVHTEQWLPLWMRAALRCGDAASLQEARQACRERLAATRVVAQDAADADLEPDPQECLAGALDHLQAAEQHAAGETAQALTQLGQARLRLPLGAASAKVHLDMAWLLAEAGQPDAGRAQLLHLRSWREEHPLGWLVHARLLAEEGHPAAAAALQQRLLAQLGPKAAPEHARLLQAYRQAMGHRQPAKGQALPRLPRLPSLMLTTI